MSEKRDRNISKALSYLLRHGALDANLPIDSEGFVPVDNILSHNRLKSLKTTFQDIQRITECNDKQRFTLDSIDGGHFKIKANQGHSLKVVGDSHLKPLIKTGDFPQVIVHGTYRRNLDAIVSAGGLSRMGRNHIHFAKGLIGENGVISGMRHSCDVMIYLDVAKVEKAGLQFYESDNGVILCAGNENGIVPLEMVEKITDKSGAAIHY